MSFLEYKKEEMMTRKEYIKNKQNNNKKDRQYKILPILTIVFILLLSIYVYRQLNIYNSVTKMTKKIVEENNLRNTEKIYYMGESYTIDDDKLLFEYSLSDKSRKVIEAGKNFSNIKIDKNYLYGIFEGYLNKIDRATYEKEKICDTKISDYLINGNKIYLYIVSKDKEKTGIYLLDQTNKKTSKIISGRVYQLIIDKKNIYTVMDGKTSKSIVRYTLKGKSKKILTDKEIVSYIIQNDNYVFYINRSKQGKIFYMAKEGKNMGVFSQGKVESYNQEEPFLNGNNVMGIVDEKLYYIDQENKELKAVNIKTKEEMSLSKDMSSIDKIQILGEKIYYSKKTDIGIYRYDTRNSQNEKITSAMQIEYVFVK